MRVFGQADPFVGREPLKGKAHGADVSGVRVTPTYEVVWDGSRERGPYLNVAPDPPPRPAGPVLRQPWELAAADRAQVIADVHATTYRETANKWRLTVGAVQVIVRVQTKRRRLPT